MAPCTGFSLCHVSGGGEKEIHAVKLTGGKQANERTLAELFDGKCKADCQHLPGVQSYVLYAFYEGSNAPQARKPLSYSTEEGFQYKGLATEGPHKEGQTMQGMRLTEAIVQGTFRTLNAIMTTAMEQNRELASELRVTRAENREMFSVMKDMIMQSTELAHEKRMKELEFERGSQERATLMRYLPALANSLFGREVFPQGVADESMFEAIAEALTPAHVEKLLEMDLPPAVVGMVMQRVNKIKEAKERGKERVLALAKATNGKHELDP